MKRRTVITYLGLAIGTSALAIGCSGGQSNPNSSGSSTSPTSASTGAETELVVYSGRNKNLVGPLIKQFEDSRKVKVQVRYGDTAELASAILEEGNNSPADVFFAQDAGALGAMEKANRVTQLPESLLSQVGSQYRSKTGQWIGITGRVRTIDYNTNQVKPEELPSSIFELTDPKWRGKIGWAPTNASFQAFVTALRVSAGEEKARQWLEGMKANAPRQYPRNAPIVEALAKGEVALGLVNHYYLEEFKVPNPQAPVAHHFTNDAGSLVNVAGAAILNTSKRPKLAEEFVAFMLSAPAQTYYATENYEYPLVEGVSASKNLKPLAQINATNLDLSNLNDLEGTLKLLESTGVL